MSYKRGGPKQAQKERGQIGPVHSVIVLGAFDSRELQRGQRRCEERSSPSEVDARRLKLTFRHGPAVPCRKLRRITACSAAFASGSRERAET